MGLGLTASYAEPTGEVVYGEVNLGEQSKTARKKSREQEEDATSTRKTS